MRRVASTDWINVHILSAIISLTNLIIFFSLHLKIVKSKIIIKITSLLKSRNSLLDFNIDYFKHPRNMYTITCPRN